MVRIGIADLADVDDTIEFVRIPVISHHCADIEASLQGLSDELDPGSSVGAYDDQHDTASTERITDVLVVHRADSRWAKLRRALWDVVCELLW